MDDEDEASSLSMLVSELQASSWSRAIAHSSNWAD
jgi:hypothetical protein